MDASPAILRPARARKGKFHATYALRGLVRPSGRQYHSASARRAAAAHPRTGRMLINLLPDFLAVLSSTDRRSAFDQYFDNHRRLLESYWHNYVIDVDTPHYEDVVRATLAADRKDL